MESEREIMREFHSLIESAKSTRAALDAPKPAKGIDSPTLVYWKDETGEHSFVTELTLVASPLSPLAWAPSHATLTSYFRPRSDNQPISDRARRSAGT